MRLSQIDESNRSLHARLGADDACLYLFEYTSGKDWKFSTTNNLISTIKRKRGQKGEYFKNKEIANCSGYFRQTLNSEWLATATLVPIPPSKSVDHPEYDNRMELICRGISPGLDVRNLVRQRRSTTAAHELKGATRPTVEELIANYELDEALTVPPPKSIGIFDDVLTAGTHYVAVKNMLTERFPGTPVFGIFIARRIFPEIEFGEW